MARFTYKATEDPDCQVCFLAPEGTKLGFVKRLEARRWAYRVEETQLWTYGPIAKHEAGSALLAIRRGLERD